MRVLDIGEAIVVLIIQLSYQISLLVDSHALPKKALFFKSLITIAEKVDQHL
jgi:hypothetical protein